MKKLLILLLILFSSQAVLAQLHTTRRTLVEEFTSSSNDACAISDKVIDQFEGEAPGHFCIVKWYLPYGTNGGVNPFYTDYPLSLVRSQYYGNDTVPKIFLNGGKHFDPTGLPIDSLRARISTEYSKTSPFILDITQQVIGDSVIANVTVRQLDTAIDLTQLAIGVIVTERYNDRFPIPDVNHIPFHTNIVRTVLPSLDPKSGEIRDALPFALAMQGQTVVTFRFASKIGVDWDRDGLASVVVIQNKSTREVLQCNWTVPEVQFMRPSVSTFLFLNGSTPCQFQIRNMTDSDMTIFPQLTHNAPSEWDLKLNGMEYPSFVLRAHTSATGTFISEKLGPFRGSCDFTLLLRTNPGIVVANISGTLVGNDSRDLIIKNWAASVYPQDPDIVTWKEFGLDAAIMNDDAVGDLFNNNLLHFRTVYVQRANYGDSTALESIRSYMLHGGRLIFNSNSVLTYFSTSIVDTTKDKYAVNFEKIFQTIPTGSGPTQWTKGNVVPGNVFTDTLPSAFSLSQRPVQPLVPTDTFSKPLVLEQGGSNVGMSIESAFGKIAYLTFPLSDIQDPATVSFMTGKILNWFKSPVSKVDDSHLNSVVTSVYPNPVSSLGTLRYPSELQKNMKFSLRDGLGRLVDVAIERINENEITFDCSGIPSGIYYYSTEQAGKFSEGKLIVSH